MRKSLFVLGLLIQAESVPAVVLPFDLLTWDDAQAVPYLLVTQMAQTNPGYAELGLPITTSSRIGNPTFACTSQTLPASAPADFDCDGDVDTDDLELFETCASGPAIPLAAGCEARDFDEDNDIDQADFGVFQRCYSGADRPAEPSCAI